MFDLFRDDGAALLVTVMRVVLAAFMFVAGVVHFVAPRGFERMMPRAIPFHRAAVLVSGACEIALAVMLLVPVTRVWGALGLIALYVAVLPANVNMAIHKIPLGKKVLPTWMLWARLPLQLVLMAWAWWVR